MASGKEYLIFILEQLSGLDDITYRAMMGEYILYYHERVIGGIYDDRFLVKPVRAAVNLMPNAEWKFLMKEQRECFWWMMLTIESIWLSCLKLCMMNCQKEKRNRT